MRADNTAAIITAARQRHERTRAKAVLALRELARTGVPVTFTTVAQAAGVSRSWLYGELDLRVEITRLRQADPAPGATPVPVTQRASDASLRRRLELAQQQIRALRTERDQLRRQPVRLTTVARHPDVAALWDSLVRRPIDPGHHRRKGLT
jgi:hypothetical protein